MWIENWVTAPSSFCNPIEFNSFAALLATVVVAAICVLISLELAQDLVQPLEPVVPHLLVALDPVMDRLERAIVEPIQPVAPVFADLPEGLQPTGARGGLLRAVDHLESVDDEADLGGLRRA